MNSKGKARRCAACPIFAQQRHCVARNGYAKAVLGPEEPSRAAARRSLVGHRTAKAQQSNVAPRTAKALLGRLKAEAKCSKATRRAAAQQVVEGLGNGNAKLVSALIAKANWPK